MKQNETDKRKVLVVHLWTKRASMNNDGTAGVTGTLNWLIQPVTRPSGGVVFGLKVRNAEHALEVVNHIIGPGQYEVSDCGDVVVVSREYVNEVPRVPLLLSRYPVRVISIDYPSKPEPRQILAVYRGRLNKTLRTFRGEVII